MLSHLVPFLLYWFIFFVSAYIIMELAQRQFYDELTPNAALKVAAGTFLMALMATWARPSYDTMFTDWLHWTALQALAWVAIFAFIFQFHPIHALAMSLAMLAIVPGAASMVVDNLTRERPVDRRTQYREAPKPIRKSASPTFEKAAPAAKTD